MLRAAEYLKRADECREIAQRAPTAAQRTMLLHIADTWLRLAEDAREKDDDSAAILEMKRCQPGQA
jgi:hypothetical protein